MHKLALLNTIRGPAGANSFTSLGCGAMPRHFMSLPGSLVER